jgi:hypothetical protein
VKADAPSPRDQVRAAARREAAKEAIAKGYPYFTIVAETEASKADADAPALPADAVPGEVAMVRVSKEPRPGWLNAKRVLDAP